MPASGLALAAEAAVRVASLNLCTDEMLLLLGRPQQIVSVSHLSRDPRESVLWQQARRFPANDGSLEGVVRFRPDLLLTMGGGARARTSLAARLGIRVVDLGYAQSPAEVMAQARHVAEALGRPGAVQPFAAALSKLGRTKPKLKEGALVGGGGMSVAPDGLSAGWLALAGYRQTALTGNRLTLERLATNPPKWLIRSDYRADQASRSEAWLRHPLVARLAGTTLRTDGRPWTCGGLPMLAEVTRLRQARPR